MNTGMKTVISFITGLSPGGAENMLVKTLEHIDKKKYRLIVASMIGGDLEEQLRKNYPVRILNTKRIISILPAILKLRNLIKKEKADVLHTYLFHANIIGRLAAIGTGAKVISSIRIKEIHKKSHNIIDSWTSSLVDKYTTVSESVRKFVIEKEKIKPEKIITIPNGLDFEKFNITIDKEKKRKELGISKGKKIIISVAHMRYTKDYPTLFKAIKIVKQKIPAHLIAVGSGEAEEEYKKTAKELNIMENVHFLGTRKDVLSLIQLSDVCVLSTFYEGQSNALLEYMAMKKPIVATDIEENREVIMNREEGLLVEPKNPEKLAEAIIEILNNKELCKKLSEQAYKKAKGKHDIKRVAHITEKLYEEICAE